MRELSFYNDLYDVDISYLIGGTVPDLVMLLNKRHPGCPPVSWDKPFEWGDDADTTNAYQFHINAPLGQGERFYVWMNEITPYLMGHETLHLTGDILFTRGIIYSYESEEAFAYLDGWLHQEIDKLLKKEKDG